jgi:excisionase family DNA binding protein
VAELTLAQAARQVGVSRATIYRAVKEGRLSAIVRPHDGQKVVDTAELIRAFGSLTPRQAETAGETAPRDRSRQPETGRETAPPTIRYLTEDDRRREVEIADR